METDEDNLLQALDDIIVDDENSSTNENSQGRGPDTSQPRRSGRVIRPTWKVIESKLEPPVVHIESAPPRRVVLLAREQFHAERNSFGLARTYKV